jgi:hypothetical protein
MGTTHVLLNVDVDPLRYVYCFVSYGGVGVGVGVGGVLDVPIISYCFALYISLTNLLVMGFWPKSLMKIVCPSPGGIMTAGLTELTKPQKVQEYVLIGLV